jgi:hypothetical protein
VFLSNIIRSSRGVISYSPIFVRGCGQQSTTTVSSLIIPLFNSLSNTFFIHMQIQYMNNFSQFQTYMLPVPILFSTRKMIVKTFFCPILYLLYKFFHYQVLKSSIIANFSLKAYSLPFFFYHVIIY